MRKIVAISMPDEMYEHLRQNVSKVRYGSVSEYVRELIRKDLKPADETEIRDEPHGRSDEPLDDADYRRIFDIRSANDFMDEYRQSIAAERSAT